MALTTPPGPLPADARDILIVLAAPPDTSAPSPDRVVAGLRLLDRIVLAADRAGLRAVLVAPLEAPHLVARGAAVDLTTAEWTTSPGRRRIVVCPGNVIPQARWLRAIAQAPVDAETLYADASGVAMIETEDTGKVLGEAARCGTISELLVALSARYPRVPAPFDPHGRFAVTRPRGVRAAEHWLLRSLIKDSEGFMSRHFERRISLAVTRRLARTAITPNTMTLVSLAVGLSCAPFFLSPHPAWQVAGALVFLAHSILDGCDGELARLKFLESRSGALLDFWGDNVVHVAVFSCMTVGWSLATASALPLIVGLAGIGAVAVASAVLSGTGLQPKPPGAEATAARVVDALANRDFIYLVLALSAIGRAWWFVAVVAAGTPIFVLVALWANRDRRTS